MSYNVEWEPEAIRVIERFEPQLVAAVLDEVDRLAATPTRLSRSGGWPHFSRDQRYEVWVDGRRVTILFQYSQDEQVLFINDVSVQ